MNKSRSRPWWGQLILFLVLSILFSALPFVFALLLNKSSLTLAISMAWYAAFPPLILLILAWLLYHHEANWAVIAGRLAVSMGIWFGLQAVFISLMHVHILMQLFALPATLAGGKGYTLGAWFFLLAGLILWLAGARLGQKQVSASKRGSFVVGSIAFLGLSIAGLFLLIALTTVPATPAPSPEVQAPSQEEVFGYIKDVYNLGIRRPGWPATEQAKDYIVSQLGKFGFTDVKVEPYTFDLWKEKTWSLSVGSGSAAWQPQTYFYPYSGPTTPEGVKAEMVYVGEPTEANFTASDVAGKIVLVDLPATNISWDQMKLFTFMAYDPANTAKGWEHPYPIGWPVIEAYDLAKAHGAVGLVGILHNYPDDGNFGYYAPYDGVIRPVPSLYVLDKDGQRLIEQIKSGTTHARLVLDADVSKGGGTAWTVFGVLPGNREGTVMVHSHYDSPWQSGVEDSSGVGMVLGLARYYAQLPADQRVHTMVFFFGGTHMIGAPANTAFMNAHKTDIMDKLLVDIAIEHIADDYNPPAASTGMVEPRGNFVYENPVMVSALAGSLVAHNTYRMLIFPTGTPLGVPTDAGMFAEAGYPVSSMICGPIGLFDNDDTLERVAVAELAPMSGMFIDFIGRLGRVPDPLLRFNLNIWMVIVIAILLLPLATFSAAQWPRKNSA